MTCYPPTLLTVEDHMNNELLGRFPEVAKTVWQGVTLTVIDIGGKTTKITGKDNYIKYLQDSEGVFAKTSSLYQ